MLYFELHKLEAKVALSFVQTVRGNMKGYRQWKVKEACIAREAQAMLGHTTDRDFLGRVRSGMITNCPVLPNAILNANHLFGPNLAGVRGRTGRRPAESVTLKHVQILRALVCVCVARPLVLRG
jgi:hypothetical protein